MRSSQDIAPIARALIGARLTESLIVFALDSKDRIVGLHEVARKSTSSCPVLPADVFRYPLIAGAAGMILAHNHPSGDVTPSPEDRTVTRRIVEVSALLGLRVLDPSSSATSVTTASSTPVSLDPDRSRPDRQPPVTVLV